MDKKRIIFSLVLAVFISPASTGEWKARVVKDLEALVTSCVVIPCSFTHPHGNMPTSRLRGIWYYSNNPDKRIYDEDIAEVVDNFKGHTKLLGRLGQNNCTLEITEIKDHDNGPFCLRIELVKTDAETSQADKHSFTNDCVGFKMLTDPPKPKVDHLKAAIQNQPFIITCSVRHTCPSHMPNLTWSRGNADEITEMYKELTFGSWEVLSILTLIPKEKDDHSELTCTATFNGGKTSSTTMKLYVKRIENYHYIIIPTLVGAGTAAIFGVACFFIVKKYRTRITQLQNRDGSTWNRLSRLSQRIRSVVPRHPPSDQRPGNINSESFTDQKTSKPRFPSPRSQQKSFNYKEDPDDSEVYINAADLHIYGNL